MKNIISIIMALMVVFLLNSSKSLLSDKKVCFKFIYIIIDYIT